MDLLRYFSDPVLRGPTVGSMLMCFTAGLVGVLVFLRRQSLVGEALSHAAYPGVIIGVILLGWISASPDAAVDKAALFILVGAFFSAWAGLWTIRLLEHRLHVRPDTALCFVLSAFIGVGVTLASEVQYSFTALYKQTLIYFYGQAATMTNVNIYVYAILALVVVAVLLLAYKELKILLFDRAYAKSIGVPIRLLDAMTAFLIVTAVVIGIRSVGVVLMSAMLVAPAVAARQYTHQLGTLFILAGTFGLLSGFLGNVISVELSQGISLPTGPTIVLVSAAICLLSLLLAPERGVVPRMVRVLRFRYRCLCENILKTFWRAGPQSQIPFREIEKYHFVSKAYLWWILNALLRQGWIYRPKKGFYALTAPGSHWAARIVRLHRLWEVYLVTYLGVGAEKVHVNAEEMEHIITPELEDELDLLLKNPVRDPHNQPIPPRE